MEKLFTVCCLDEEGSVICSYAARSLLYAKRYADLYRDEYPVIQICSRAQSGEETIFETFTWRKEKVETENT